LSTLKPLTEEQKRFISDNLDSMSARGIAEKLGVPRHTVQDYRKQLLSEKTAGAWSSRISRFYRSFKSRPARNITIVLFLAILALAINLRQHTFNLPHYKGDQQHYLGLAFKLDTRGISGYNLRGINPYGNLQYPHRLRIGAAEGKGQMLKTLERANITYYDQPLHHIPFGFPLAIMLSHKIFAPGDPYYGLTINVAEIIRKAPPGAGLRNFRFDPSIAGAQFYSIIVPFSFSLLLIILVYLLAKKLYNNDQVALIAMFLMAISPIDILSSQKLWADDMTAALAALSILLYILSIDKKMPILAFAGGISCGLSAITKQNGAFIVFVVIIWHLITNFDRLFRKDTFLKVIFDRNLILFGLGAILSAGYWFAKVTSVYGNPVYRPHQAGISRVAEITWFKTVGSRSRYLYLAGIPYQNPLFALAYIAPLWLFLDKKRAKNTLLPIIWIAVFLYIFQVYLGRGGKEHRYMLPAYPAYAILGAYIANRLRMFIDRKTGFRVGTVLLLILLAASAFWSIPMGLDVVFMNKALILKPF